MREKKVADSKTVMTEMIMPNDTNPIGDLMGGNLLRWMDIIAAITAGKHCESHVVTASVDHVSFTQSIHLGDVITIQSCVTRAFNTSVEVFVEVFAANIKGPQVVPLTREEVNLFDHAIKRRELRLVLSGRLKPSDATEIKSLFTEDQ